MPPGPRVELLLQPADSNRLGDHLNVNFAGPWTHFRAAVAFVKRSGTKHLRESLANFAQSGDVEMLVGIDHNGSSEEGLRDLIDAVAPKGRLLVFHNALAHTFHPKVYLFKSQDAAEVIVGSGNLTQGGLFTNYEASTRHSLDLRNSKDRAFLRSIEEMLDRWSEMSAGISRTLDHQLLDRLVKLGLVQAESTLSRPSGKFDYEGPTSELTDPDGPAFLARTEPAAPLVPARRRHGTFGGSADDRIQGTRAIANDRQRDPHGFVMTLQKTDVGTGQTSTGTSRRSPEIFIPLKARDVDPGFWGWPAKFSEDPKKPGKFDRKRVRMKLGDDVILVNMMTWPDKRDFRLRNERLRNAGNVEDILYLRKSDSDEGCEFGVEVIPKNSSIHAKYLALCNRSVKNSKKRFGYL